MVDGNYVYWIDDDTGILHRTLKEDGGISERVNVFLQDVLELRLIRKSHLLESKFTSPRGRAINCLTDSRFVDSALSVQYACTEDVCSNICLPNWDLLRYSCACPTGIQDQKKCPPGKIMIVMKSCYLIHGLNVN